MRVAVVGAGVSGLTAIKCCLDEGLDDVVCFESRNDLGGVWNYTETVQPGQSNVARSEDFVFIMLWLGSLVFGASDLRLNGREFDPRTMHYRSVGTGLGDRLRARILPSRYVTSHPGQLSLLPSVGWEMSIGQSRPTVMSCGCME